MALVERDSYWVAAYFKERQLRHIASGDIAMISLMGDEDLRIRIAKLTVGSRMVECLQKIPVGC